MATATKDELDKIVNVLVDTGIVSKVILFGSHANGEATPGSDIDLCVLTSVKDRRPIDLMKDFGLKIYRDGACDTALDLLAYNEDEFSMYASRPGSFHHEIKERGVVLYG